LSRFPDERTLLPDRSRSFPFGWGFHLASCATAPMELSKDQRRPLNLLLDTSPLGLKEKNIMP
jgi:hypothetical protein